MYLILRDLAALGEQRATEFIGELHGLCERQPNVRIVITAHSENLLTGTEEGSSFLSLGYQYRMGWFDVKQIIDAGQNPGSNNVKSCTLTKDQANKVLDHTGGVPLLVYDLLRRIDQYRGKGKVTVTLDHIIKAVRAQRNARHHRLSYGKRA